MRDEHVTATGWRLVGKAAQMVREHVQLYGDDVPAGGDEDVLFGARFRVQPRTGRQSPVGAVLTTIETAVRAVWDGAPPLTPDRPAAVPAGRFHGLRWIPEGTRGAWRGELRWRHAHPVMAGAPCTTHVVVVEQESHVTLAVRVTADRGLESVRGMVGAGQARPAFLSHLGQAVRLSAEWGNGEPHTLGERDIDAFVRDTLLAGAREYPVVVLAPLESGGYAVPPEQVADELLGLAPLYAIDRHASTFRLSDAVGDRRLSCYWGALRVYMPEFSCADRGEEHPLLVHERVEDPVMRASVLGILGRAAGRRHAKYFTSTTEDARTPEAHDSDRERADDAPPITAAGEHTEPSESTGSQPARTDDTRGGVHEVAAVLVPLMREVATGLGQLREAIGLLAESHASLHDEMLRLRTTTTVRSASTGSLERRLERVERLLRNVLSPAEASGGGGNGAAQGDDAVEIAATEGDDTSQPSVLDAVRHAAAAHPDALLVLDTADQSAADSPYEDVERLEAVLNAMASLARRRQEGALGVPLRQAFRELGIDYRGGISPNTSERLLQQYVARDAKGRAYECVEHIALGASYDPRHCLRIYFTSRAPLEPRFVIGHVGRHFEVESTS